MMISIEVSHIISFHQKIVKEPGGSEGIRDIGLIESSLKKAFITFDGEICIKEILEKFL